MPTSLTTAELRGVNAGIRQRSFLSAQNILVALLDKEQESITRILKPQTSVREDGTPFTSGINAATARLEIKELIQRIGYQPDPEKRGTIEDLSSDQRINLVLKTNTEIAQNYGAWRQGQSEPVLDQWPAAELYRLEGRKEPRDWTARWRTAGDQTGDPIGTGWTITPLGRLVALKNHPIWDRLGSTSLFDDGLDNPYPPFAFGSGMDVRDVDRTDAMQLGLIDRDTQVQPKRQGFELDEIFLAALGN